MLCERYYGGVDAFIIVSLIKYNENAPHQPLAAFYDFELSFAKNIKHILLMQNTKPRAFATPSSSSYAISNKKYLNYIM